MFDKNIAKRMIAAPMEAGISEDDIRGFAGELNKYDYYSIICDQINIELCQELFRKPRVGVMVSYPFGGMTTETKVRLTEIAIEKGCSEINICPDYVAIKSGDYETAKKDMEAVYKAADNKLDIVLVPMVGLMTLEEIKNICDMCLEIGIHILKTNAGLGMSKSEVEHIRYIKRMYGDKIQIEVSGGVRNLEQAREFVSLGADRVHTSTWKSVIDVEDQV
jgi:deoxyribose-phosphate aldolase